MRDRLRLAWPLRLASVALMASGCLPSISDLDSGPLDSTFAVSDFFSPSGFMGDGEFFGDLVGSTNEGCKPRPPGARGNCYRFTYYPNNVDIDPWAGVYWVFPSNSWGSTPGHAIDIKNFNSISFYAAIDGPTPFTVNSNPPIFNGLAGNINPGNFYSMKTPGALDYQDAEHSTGGFYPGMDVTGDLKQFHFAIKDLDKGQNCVAPGPGQTESINCNQFVTDPDPNIGLHGYAKYLIGAFAWSVHYPIDSVACRDGTTDCRMDQHSSQFVNPQPVHIYLDDIVWDTQPAPTTP
jgi:hypothetical protein